ncbi:MAG: HlyD family efflux transporter periplasmic adaptor subunit [Paracoccaceae bacterium]|nr:HlyD family efflux transporter periplasmic adaptor subunit [Paracoccaceae bacterium]
MSLSPRTLLISGLGIALVGFLAVTAFREDPVPVDLAEISRGNLQVTVDAEGETRVRHRFDVNAPITGTLQRMPLEVGDPVVAGETIIARIEPASAPLLDANSRAEALAVLHDAEAQIRFAEAEIKRTTANADYAQNQLDRAEALVRSGVATLTRVEDAAVQLALAEAEVVSAEARMAMALASKERAEAVLQEPDVTSKSAACCLRILSPANGVVLDQPNASARPVQAGENLAAIGDPTNLEVVVDLLSSDATRIREGAAASLERWGGPGALDAVVRRIEPTARTVVSALGIDEQRVDVRLEITSPRNEWAGLGHGFSVFVRIEEWRAEDVLLVPLSAVFQKDGTWFTFRANNETAHLTEIAVGRRDGRMAVVEAGLNQGDRVVMHPPDTIRDGSTITERERF